MRKAFKYRIYLTNGQRRILGQQLEECRWVYNQTLATRRDAYEQGVSLSWYENEGDAASLEGNAPLAQAGT